MWIYRVFDVSDGIEVNDLNEACIDGVHEKELCFSFGIYQVVVMAGAVQKSLQVEPMTLTQCHYPKCTDIPFLPFPILPSPCAQVP